MTWCSSQREDPRRCTIGVVLSFLQERLERRLSPSTLKVYVAAIAAHHNAVDGRSLGKHDLIVRFLKGARRMNPSSSPLVPSWDLSIVLAGLQRGPFELLDSVELKFLALKTALLTALTSIKWVGDLQAFSVSEECLVFGPVYSHVVLRPRPGYVPKVPTTPFRDQVVNLQALPSEEADPALALLCPVRALRIYVERTRSVRTSEQLFVCQSISVSPHVTSLRAGCGLHSALLWKARFPAVTASCNNKKERPEAVFHWRSKSLPIPWGKE